jgi:16S rRNA (guanine527-N7)-methyltransferase
MNNASRATALELEDVRWVGPYAGSRHRHLHLLRKVAPTPANLPRRAGIAKKRPLGSA